MQSWHQTVQINEDSHIRKLEGKKMLKFIIYKNEDEYVLIIEYEDKAERLLASNLKDLVQAMADTTLYNFEGKSKYFEQSYHAKIEIT